MDFNKKISNTNFETLKGKAEKAFPFKVQKRSYKIVQLIPTKSSKSPNANRLFDEINKMYSKVFTIEDKKIIYNQPYKLLLYLEIKKNSANYYVIYPVDFENKIELMLNSNWRGIEIKELNEFPVNLNEFEERQITYTKDDSLSINNDSRDKYLLTSIISVSKTFDEDEEIGILYNFIPTRQKESDFFRNETYKKQTERYKLGEDLSKVKSISSYGQKGLKFTIGFVEETINCLFNQPDKKCEAFKQLPKKISPSTRDKGNTNLCKTQIAAFVKSKDNYTTDKIFLEINKAFDIVTGDNKLVTKKIKAKNNNPMSALYNPTLANLQINRTCINECNNFFKIPNRQILDECKTIVHNENIELFIPKCLLKGIRPICYAKQQGVEVLTYFSSDKQISRAEVVIIGPKGAGKTHVSTNLAKNSIKAGRGSIIIELIEDCAMCKSILADPDIPKSRIVNIDCREYENIPALCYNEIEMWDDMDPKLKVERAIQRGQQLQYFLDSINDEESSLKPRMIKYFFAACAVVYCVDHNASFNDIMNCLTDPEIREEYINSLKEKESKLLETRIKTLRELTKENGKNDNNKIDGILNREALFSSVSFQAEMISKKRADNNIDFKEALQDNKVILIQLPEQIFTSPSIKNTMATFFLAKIWNAKKQLSKNDDKQPTELYFDEFYKCPNAMRIFEDIFVEGRKFNITPVVTVHTLDELSNKCKTRLINGGASYILLYGTNANDFKYLRPYIDDSLEYDDLKHMPRFHGMCIIKNEEKNCSTFIGYFPKEFPNIWKNKEENKN